MRDSVNWKTELVKRLTGDSKKSAALVDVELALTLVSEIFPNETPAIVPALLSGNPIPELNPSQLSESQRGMLARGRILLRYFQGESAWRNALVDYQLIDETIRLYNVQEGAPATLLQSSICPDRQDIYLKALRTPPPHSNTSMKSAEDGTYFIQIRKNDGKGEMNWHPITFTSEEIQNIHGTEPVRFRSVEKRNPLTIPWQVLRETADWMDNVSDESWRKRLEGMRVSLGPNDDSKAQSALKLDGLFHLVGMVGSGKSTLMDIIAVWAARERLRIMLVVGDNVDVVERVEKFRKFGLNSVPLMGTNTRDNQVRQIERVVLNDLKDGGRIWEDSRLNWVSPICPIVGFGQSDIPVVPIGEEPCEKIHVRQDEKSTRRRCPLMSVCPAHRARNEMLDANIWVGTPFSLALTRAPAQSIAENIRLLETVYRECDIVIVDEADRVQTQLDEMFSPSGSLSSSYGLMEQLDRDAAIQEGSSLNSIVSRSEVLDWSRAQGQSKQAISVLLNLCSSNSNIREWVMQRGYFTAFSLASSLHSELSQDRESAIPEGMLNFLGRPDLDSPLQRLADELILRGDRSVNLSNRADDAFEWLKELYPDCEDEHDKRMTLLLKLEAIAVTAILDNELKSVFDGWDVAEGAYNLGPTGDLPFQRPPRDYAPLVPRSPTGNLFGFRYQREAESDARIEMFRFTGVGRWILTNLPDMFKWIDDIEGPNVLLLSGSSWAPGSSSYHVHAPVDGVLLPPKEVVDSIEKSEASFDYALDPYNHKPIRVSGGRGEQRIENLEGILRYLTDKTNGSNSLLETELDDLESTDDRGKRILLVTGSYEETKRAYEFIRNRDGLAGKVMYMIRDNEDGKENWESDASIRRGLVNRFADQSAHILIAPLMAIERGHNIIDERGRAKIGSVYFLVRPMPVPYQFSTAVRKMNFWAMNKWAEIEDEPKAESVLAGWTKYNRMAHSEWWRILQGYTSFATLSPTERADLAWTQLVALWQTSGRAVRGGNSVRVHFCDAAFAPDTAAGQADSEETSLLIAMRMELAKFTAQSGESVVMNERERWVCESLYRPWATALSKIRNLDD